MLIALPTDDGHTIAPHLSKATAFDLYDVIWPAPTSVPSPSRRRRRGRAVEPVPSAPGRTTLVGRRHPKRPKGVGPGGGCGGHSERGSVHHESAIRVLTGVDAVICRNLGLGLLRDLEFLGVDVYPCALDSIEEALDLFARGQLAADYMRVCRCGR